MPTRILRLLGFDGPNRYGPQTGVLLQVFADKDRSKRLRNALKDGGQSVSMVIGALNVSAEPVSGGFTISAHFATPTPGIGVALAEYIVDGLNAKEAGDEQWDADGPLWELQKRRRAGALPIRALQLIAEASSRDLPAVVRPDGALQIGYGARSWAIDLAALRDRREGVIDTDEVGTRPPFARANLEVAVPWEQIGIVPIIVVSGAAGRDTAARRIADALATNTGLLEQWASGGPAQNLSIKLATPAGFDATRALLADTAMGGAVIGLDPVDLARRGLAFERCTAAVIVSRPDVLDGVGDPTEVAEALGVPMLVTTSTGCVALNADDPAIAALAEYAPCQVVLFSASAENRHVAQHRAVGGTALFVRDGMVVAAVGVIEHAYGPVSQSPDDPYSELAALALVFAGSSKRSSA
jgi:hypothetical protein